MAASGAATYPANIFTRDFCQCGPPRDGQAHPRPADHARQAHGRQAGLSWLRCAAYLFAVLAAAATGGSPCLAQGSETAPFTLSTLNSNAAGALAMTQVNSGHGCKGGNSPPAMQWSAPPAGTKSFAVTLFDVTARKGEGFWHWALFDVPPSARKLDLNETPGGAKSGRNDFGDAGYGGACPPPGETHQYKLTVWALGDPTLPFDSGSSDKEIGAYLKGRAIGSADLTLFYKR